MKYRASLKEGRMQHEEGQFKVLIEASKTIQQFRLAESATWVKLKCLKIHASNGINGSVKKGS
jgi:hypothetical protein